MVSHEYGSKTQRFHHHVIIFGWEPKKQTLLTRNKGNPLFESEELKKLWKHGFHSIGEANEKTAYYIAAYALKGNQQDFLDADGEIHKVRDFFDCSKNPGIGLNYFKNNYKQMVDNKELIPRYYQKKLETLDPDYFELYENHKQTLLKNLDPLQKFSKFKVAKAKRSLADNNFRGGKPDDLILERYMFNNTKEMKK